MKEAIGGVFLFNIVIFFILLFTGIMCLTINRSKAYQIKDEIITLIEENNGMTMTTNDSGNHELWDSISDVLSNAAYRTTGTCPDEWNNGEYISADREGNLSTEPSVCIKKTEIDPNELLSSGNYSYSDDSVAQCYYTVVIFYKLDIPVMSQVFNFSILGETKKLYSSEYCG